MSKTSPRFLALKASKQFTHQLTTPTRWRRESMLMYSYLGELIEGKHTGNEQLAERGGNLVDHCHDQILNNPGL